MPDATRKPATSDAAVSDALRRDLALVLPEVAPLKDAAVQAFVTGQPVSLDDALAEAATLIGQSRAPALAGLTHLSIEAAREAVALAETMRGRLLPWPFTSGAAAGGTSGSTSGGNSGGISGGTSGGVVTTATLGHIFQSDLIIWVGRDRYDEAHPIAQAIAARQLLAMFVDATLEAVLTMRKQLRSNPQADPIGRHKRIAVVLPPNVAGVLASQWNKLAAALQEQVRISVLPLPARDAGNLRGITEVVTWQTGVSPAARGGVDFGDGAPRPCADLQTLLTLSAIDLLILAGAASARVVERDPDICIGPQRNSAARITIVTPALAPGLAGRVMRCDGIVLSLGEPSHACPPDPTVAVLARLRQALETQA